MDKKKKKKRKVVTNKKQYHLITDTKNPHRDTATVSFESKEEIQDYLVSEFENRVDYDFEDGDDILIYGELQTVKVTEKTYKITIK